MLSVLWAEKRSGAHGWARVTLSGIVFPNINRGIFISEMFFPVEFRRPFLVFGSDDRLIRTCVHQDMDKYAHVVGCFHLVVEAC